LAPVIIQWHPRASSLERIFFPLSELRNASRHLFLSTFFFPFFFPTNVIPPEVMADLEDVARQAAAGDVRDPELVRRVRERAEKVRHEILAKFGVQDIGVSIIRQMRDVE
jgi:hypothetical protein